MKKALRAAFEDFFASPSHQKLEELLRSHGGEYNDIDYKEQWLEYPAIARHILAIGNSGGGVIIFGVRQHDGSLESVGLKSLRDKAAIYGGLFKFIPKSFEFDKEWSVYDFSYKEGPLDGRKFQAILAENRPNLLPLISAADGGASSEIRNAAIYVRRGTSSVEANYEELQRIINVRIDTKYSSTPAMALEQHLDQLRALYRRISAYTPLAELFVEQIEQMGGSRRSPHYPQESYEAYIAKLIDRKKRFIDSLIGGDAP